MLVPPASQQAGAGIPGAQTVWWGTECPHPRGPAGGEASRKSQRSPIPRGRGEVRDEALKRKSTRPPHAPRFQVLGHPRVQHTCDHWDRRTADATSPRELLQKPQRAAGSRLCQANREADGDVSPSPAASHSETGQGTAQRIPARLPRSFLGVPAQPDLPQPHDTERPHECQLRTGHPWALGLCPSRPLVGLNPHPTPSSADRTPEVTLQTDV